MVAGAVCGKCDPTSTITLVPGKSFIKHELWMTRDECRECFLVFYVAPCESMS